MAAAIKALVTQVLKSILQKIGVGAAGVWAVVLNYGGQYLADYIMDLVKKLERKKEQEAALAKQEEVQKNPASTVEERAKAYEDVINAGRK